MIENVDTQALTHRYWRLVKLNWRYLLGVGLLVVVYVVAAKLGLLLARTTAQVTVVWPPSGIALAALLVFGVRFWPGIFIGAFIANLLTNEQSWVALGIAAGNTLEAVVGALLLQRVAWFRRTFVTPRDVIAFTLVAVLCTLLAALIGTACLVAGGLAQWPHFWEVAATWWQGDVMGILVFGSFLLVYADRRAFAIVRGRWIEGIVLVAATIAMSLLVFNIRATGPLTFPYMMFPLLVWAAARFTQVGVATGGLIVAAAAIWATLDGRGPFVEGPFVEAALVHLQLYVCVLTASSLTLAMAITERIEAEAELGRQARKMERLDADLKEANKRITNILAGILDAGAGRSHHRDHDNRDR